MGIGSSKSMAKLFIIAGGESQGKDEIIRAVYEMGGLHAQVITKYTTRLKKEDDGREIIGGCKFIDKGKETVQAIIPDAKSKICNITYERNYNKYGFNTNQIWKGLRNNKFQVVSVSEVDTINKLRELFSNLVVLIYVHSYNKKGEYPDLEMFSRNFDQFDHVLIYEDKREDLYDQLFRLFRAYE